MANPNKEPMMKMANLLVNMQETWNDAGGIAPDIKSMDGDLTALDLLITMAANDIFFVHTRKQV